MFLKDIIMDIVHGKPRIYFKFSNDKFAAVEFPKDGTPDQVKEALISMAGTIDKLVKEEDK